MDYDGAKAFFRPSPEALHDPFLMKDMDKAVARLAAALEEGESIMVFGDYDVDGTTAVSLVYGFLSDIGAQVSFYIPDRYAEGYGLSVQGIDRAKEEGRTLLITLDCGIKAVEKVAYANKQGIDVIICDHHRPGLDLPAAHAILNPKQEDCGYPYKELCGCGVGFKLMQALAQDLDLDDAPLWDRMDLLAVAIGADIVPITGENRVMMQLGLKKLNSSPSPGLGALMGVADVQKEMTVTDVVFIIAPRINAAGRIEHGSNAVELLTCPEPGRMKELATNVNVLNTERKDLDRSITEEALEKLAQDAWHKDAMTTVVYDSSWHKGVVGIVASRLTETHYRPTIVLTESNGMATGSARSVRHFDVHEAISECEDLLENFGGHKYAAGLTLKTEHLPVFKERFEQAVRERMDPEWLIPELRVDMEIPLLRVDRKFFNVLRQMAPFGPGNMKPVFVTRGCRDTGYAKEVGTGHLKMTVYQGPEDIPIRAIAFGQVEHLELVKSGKPFDLVYSIDENTFNGRTSLQLMVKDVRASEA